MVHPRRLETRLKHGYLGVRISMDCRQFLVTAHRLVWTTLVGPIPPGIDVNHKNGRKDDNTLSNLELVTRGENHKHAYRTGLRKAPVTPLSAETLQAAKTLRAAGLSFSKIASTLSISQTSAFNAQQR